MNLIEEFMKRYQELLDAYAIKRISNEQYAAALISMASQAMGLSRRVRAAHLKALAMMIFQSVDKERQEACARCERPLEVVVSNSVTYDIADIRDVAYRARAVVHSMLHAHGHEVPDSHYPSLAVAQMDGHAPRIFMKIADSCEVLYSFAIGKTKDGGLKVRDPWESIATDYILRHKMGTFV